MRAQRFSRDEDFEEIDGSPTKFETTDSEEEESESSTQARYESPTIRTQKMVDTSN